MVVMAVLTLVLSGSQAPFSLEFLFLENLDLKLCLLREIDTLLTLMEVRSILSKDKDVECTDWT